MNTSHKIWVVLLSETNNSHNMQNNISKNSNFHYSKTIEKIKKPNEIRVLTIGDEVRMDKMKIF